MRTAREIDAGDSRADLLGRRPDLRAAELRLRESLSQIKVTRVSYYPAICLRSRWAAQRLAVQRVAHPVETLGSRACAAVHSLE